MRFAAESGKCGWALAGGGRRVDLRQVNLLEVDLSQVRPSASTSLTPCLTARISKLGGLTKTRQVRDLCVSMGIVMTLEDSWGGDITTAAIAHLAHSTPEEFRFTSTDFNSYVTVRNAHGAPQRELGFIKAGDASGLGVSPIFEVLGAAVVQIS